MQNSKEGQVKAYFKCPKSYRREFENSKCALPISVGQGYHEGDEFEATIDLINRSNFKECVIIVCDTLQRHTIQALEGCGEKRAYNLALEQSKGWLKRNHIIYDKLDIPYSIMHWDEWLNSSQYKTQKKVIDNLYKRDVEFKTSVNDCIMRFINSKNHVMCGDFETKYLTSLDYIREESTIMLLWLNELINFEIYPGKRQILSAIIYKHFVESFNTDLQRWLQLCFKRDRHYKRQ